MSDYERIEQLELENKVLQDNNKGLKAKIDELQKELEQEKGKNKKLKKQSEISAKTHIKNDDLKDKVIDKMAKTIAGLQLYDFGRKEYFTLEDEGEVREYFYKKVEVEDE